MKALLMLLIIGLWTSAHAEQVVLGEVVDVGCKYEKVTHHENTLKTYKSVSSGVGIEVDAALGVKGSGQDEWDDDYRYKSFEYTMLQHGVEGFSANSRTINEGKKSERPAPVVAYNGVECAVNKHKRAAQGRGSWKMSNKENCRVETQTQEYDRYIEGDKIIDRKTCVHRFVLVVGE